MCAKDYVAIVFYRTYALQAHGTRQECYRYTMCAEGYATVSSLLINCRSIALSSLLINCRSTALKCTACAEDWYEVIFSVIGMQ